jgi:hypothetical protein
MKKGLSELFGSNKSANLFRVLAIILLAVLYLHYKLVFILEPSSFDMILELTVLKLAPILKPSIALSNYRPQLGQLTFLLTGESAKVFGIIGGYVIRYVLFILNLLVLLHLFKEFSENKKFNAKNLIFFLLTFGLTFFATIKYFYVVDFLTSLLFSFLSLLLILQNRSKVAVFICLALSIYFKFSILLFLLPLLVIGQNRPKDLLRYTLPISLAVAFGLGMFLMKNVEQVLGQRGLFTILKHEGILNFMIVNIFAPWEFFTFFDQSVATYSLAWGPYVIAKAILIFALGILIFIKNKLKASIDFICLVASVTGIIAIQPNDPWFHDIGFYVGMIGLLGMFIAWKYKTVIFTKSTGLIVVAIFTGDFFFWNQSIKEVDIATTKFVLQDTLKQEISANKVTDLYLYCMNNIGEFEWNLRGNTDLKIHYVVDQQDVAESLNRVIQSKTIWLFPKKCLHEKPPENIGNDPSSSASFKREFYLNSMEYYRLYSNY